MKRNLLLIATLATALILSAASCDGKKSSDDTISKEDSIALSSNSSPFIADSAMANIRKQVEFGPRVPNTPSHKATAKYLADYLRYQGLTVNEQLMTLTAWDNTELNAVNIIGEFNPSAPKRILLFAHWDTRPWADEDSARKDEPIDGADDGASGVGVLMEIARLLKEHPLQNIGVDIVFFDAEDYGVRNGANFDGDREATWALGTQFWTKTPHRENYKADFGILLDMVGSKDAKFYRERYSQENAGQYVSKIWETAARLGHKKLFKNEMGGTITDDHFFVMKYLRIPCVDIINYDPKSNNGFGDYWHTHGDNLDNISTETLNAVGRTIWQVLVDYDATQTNQPTQK